MRSAFVKDGKTVAVGSIDDLPGCSQIAVFHSSFVLPEFRKNGIGQKAHKERLQMAKSLGYDAAICTVNAENEAQVQILRSNGWILIMTFVSKKTQNTVSVYMKEI